MMKLIQRLFNKQSKTITLKEKIQALDKQSQASLEDMVVCDTTDVDELRLKEVVLQRLPYCPAIIYSVNSGFPMLEKAARIRLAELIDTKKIGISLLKQHFDDADVLLDISSYSHDETLQNSILQGIEDQKKLVDICVASRFSSVRRLLAERIDSVDLLRTLSDEFRNKDKTAYRIVKKKLDKVKEKDNVAISAEKQVEVLCNEMKSHSLHVYDKMYGIDFDRLLQRWCAVDSIKGVVSEKNGQRFCEAKNICKQRILVQKEKHKAEKQCRKKLSSVYEDRQLLLEKLCLKINQIYVVDEINEVIIDVIFKEKEVLMRQWDKLSYHGVVDVLQRDRYVLLCDATEDLMTLFSKINVKGGTVNQAFISINNAKNADEIDAKDIMLLRQSLNIIKNIEAFPAGERLVAYKELLIEVDSNVKEKKAFEEKKFRAVSNLLAQGMKSLDRGDMKEALGVRYSVNEKLTLLPAPPNKIMLQLDSLNAAIEKLLDWQDYAVVPKKEALIASMQELIDVGLSPDILAKKIKKLQDEWQALRQHGKNQHQELWERFSQLANDAYVPCQIYYQGLAGERQQNLEKRKTVVQQLKDYLCGNDWNDADWKKVEIILQAARKEFYSYVPVERKINKAIVSDFDVAIHALQAKLSEGYAKNSAIKVQMIQQATTLEDHGNVDQAISEVKRLQALWKNVGRCSYKEDQKLWREFRKHCDSLFAKKASIIADQESDKKSNLTSAQALIAKVDAYLVLLGEDFLAMRSACQDDREAFSSLGELPAYAKNKINDDFFKKITQIEIKESLVLEEINRQSWEDFFSLLTKINRSQYEMLSSNEDSPNALQVLAKDVSQVKRLPAGGRDVLNDRLQQVLKSEPFDQSSNIERLTLLCIRTEVASDTISPDSDKELRMEYQVNLLKQGFGCALQVNNAPEVIGFEWAVIGPVDSETYRVLFERFYTVWKKLQ